MRLADEIIASAGGVLDIGGFRTSMSAAIVEAQKFEIDADAVAACANVGNSKPSSILSARHLARLPYQKVWVEWVCPPTDRPANNKEMPARLGFLAEAVVSSNDFQVTWAWSHKEHGLNICPVAAMFSLELSREKARSLMDRMDAAMDAGGAKLPAELVGRVTRAFTSRRELLGLDDEPAAIARARAVSRSAWKDLPDEEIRASLELNSRIFDGISPHAESFVDALAKTLPPKILGKTMDSYYQDLEGEPTFALAFLLMLNSPNALERKPRENFDRLNRAREKAGKCLPLQEFTVTKIRLPKGVMSSAGGSAAAIAERRAHLVRGHFKVRRTGVFWWSPHLWGRGRPAVERGAYLGSGINVER